MDERTFGQRLARAVMVGHDHVHAELPREGDLPDRPDAAVRRQQEVGALVVQLLHGLPREAVPVLGPVRQPRSNCCAERPERTDRKRCRADAVDVIVAVDCDYAPAPHVIEDQLDRLRHVAKLERVVAVGGLQEAPR
jgi:hypothetical protein